MPEYLMLFRFTSKGVQNIKDAPQRIKSARQIFEKNGAKVKHFYAVLGQYDTFCVAEAPDDETIAKISLQISSLGNVQGQTLRAFPEEQVIKMIESM